MRRSSIIGFAVASSLARAHGDTAPAVASSTSIDGIVLVVLALLAVLYARGVRALWSEAGRGRGITFSQAASGGAAFALLALAQLPSFEEAAGRSFAVHMLQHQILMLLIAPLLVLAQPLAAWTWALPVRWRGPVGRAFATSAWRVPYRIAVSIPFAASLQLAVLIAWHVPGLFDATVRTPALHLLQHTTFLAVAVAFWWALLGPRGQGRTGAALAALFVTMLATGAIGALLVFASHAWYATYDGAGDALVDQQLGGLVMWVPGGTAYLVAAVAMMARWLARARRSNTGVESNRVAGAAPSPLASRMR